MSINIITLCVMIAKIIEIGMSKARRLYRCKICGIFLSRREKILSHFFDRHSSGQDSFEEVVLPDLKINVTRQVKN